MHNPYEGYVRNGSIVTVKFRSGIELPIIEVVKVKKFKNDFWFFRNELGQEWVAYDFEYMEIIRF